MYNVIFGLLLIIWAVYGLVSREYQIVLIGTEVPITLLVLVIGIAVSINGISGMIKRKKVSELTTLYITEQISIEDYSRKVIDLLGREKGSLKISSAQKRKEIFRSIVGKDSIS
jgi:hypothetical protein